MRTSLFYGPRENGPRDATATTLLGRVSILGGLVVGRPHPATLPDRLGWVVLQPSRLRGENGNHTPPPPPG